MTPNPYEDRARMAKVLALVEALDERCRMLHVTAPYDALAETIAEWGPELRLALCDAAGVKPASETTWAEVVAVYRDRARRAQARREQIEEWAS